MTNEPIMTNEALTRVPGAWPGISTSRLVVFAVTAIVLVGLGLSLRLHLITEESFTGDEILSIHIATASAAREIDEAEYDLVHPPLYYFALRPFLDGDSHPSALKARAFSLICGAATIVIVLTIGLLNTDLRVPSMLASLLLALNSLHIFFSQQVRSYALYTALVTLLLLWATCFERFAAKRRYWILGTILMTAIAYTHYVGTFYCAAAVLPLLVNADKQSRRRGLLALATVAALLLPWLATEVSVYRSKGGLSSNLGWIPPATFSNFRFGFAEYLGVLPITGATSLALLIAATLMTPVFLKARKDRTALLLLTMGLGVPTLAFLTAKLPATLPIFGSRHLLPSLVPFLLAVSWGAWIICTRVQQAYGVPRVALIGLITLLLSSLELAPVMLGWDAPRRVPYRQIAEVLSQQYKDRTTYTTWWWGAGQSVNFYLAGTEQRVLPTPEKLSNLPDNFVLLYRAVEPSEASVVEAIKREGYVVVKQELYTAPHSEWGTTLLLLRKAG